MVFFHIICCFILCLNGIGCFSSLHSSLLLSAVLVIVVFFHIICCFILCLNRIGCFSSLHSSLLLSAVLVIVVFFHIICCFILCLNGIGCFSSLHSSLILSAVLVIVVFFHIICCFILCLNGIGCFSLLSLHSSLLLSFFENVKSIKLCKIDEGNRVLIINNYDYYGLICDAKKFSYMMISEGVIRPIISKENSIVRFLGKM